MENVSLDTLESDTSAGRLDGDIEYVAGNGSWGFGEAKAWGGWDVVDVRYRWLVKLWGVNECSQESEDR